MGEWLKGNADLIAAVLVFLVTWWWKNAATGNWPGSLVLGLAAGFLVNRLYAPARAGWPPIR